MKHWVYAQSTWRDLVQQANAFGMLRIMVLQHNDYVERIMVLQGVSKS
jgi:hypothetical protein